MARQMLEAPKTNGVRTDVSQVGSGIYQGPHIVEEKAHRLPAQTDNNPPLLQEVGLSPKSCKSAPG